MKTTLKCIIGWLSFFGMVEALGAGTPASLPLPLPLDGKKFSTYSIEFSGDGERACIAGTDYDDLGTSTARVLLIDRKRMAMVWQKTVPVPDGLADLFPIQCLVGADRVYLLANADTSLSPPEARTEAHVIAFDMRGNQTASRRVNIPSDSRHGYTSEYGYAMSEGADGLSVVGYTRDQEGDTERYGTYTVTLDVKLQQHGSPLFRRNGAYTGPVGVRMVGDSIYLAGRFFEATVSNHDIGEFAASRLRTGGGYIWSTRTALKDLSGINIAVADDGTSYSLGYTSRTTMLMVVTPDGKAPVPLTLPSMYCRTRAVARYGSGIIAVREPCSGKGNALVSIDTATGKEQQVKSVPDEPLYVATKGTLWAVLARDRTGRLYLYSAAAGGL